MRCEKGSQYSSILIGPKGSALFVSCVELEIITLANTHVNQLLFLFICLRFNYGAYKMNWRENNACHVRNRCPTDTYQYVAHFRQEFRTLNYLHSSPLNAPKNKWIDDNTKDSAIVSLMLEVIRNGSTFDGVENSNAKMVDKIRKTKKYVLHFFQFNEWKQGNWCRKIHRQGILWAINHEFLAVGQKINCIKLSLKRRISFYRNSFFLRLPMNRDNVNLFTSHRSVTLHLFCVFVSEIGHISTRYEIWSCHPKRLCKE